MDNINLEIDGWNAIIADEFTVKNVNRIAKATLDWMKSKSMKKVVIGHDCRFGGKLFSETVARILASNGIKVVLNNGFVSSPMVSLGIINNKADAGVIIAASNYPPDYNGYKLKSKFGGPISKNDIDQINLLIPDEFNKEILSFDAYRDAGLIEFKDLEGSYLQHLNSKINMTAINEAGLMLTYDGMFGSGQRIIERILPNALRFRCNYDPSFQDQTPNPIAKNIVLLGQLVAGTPNTCCGVAIDGEANRITMYDEKGKILESDQLLLLMLYFLKQSKMETGKVVFTSSVGDVVKRLARKIKFDVIILDDSYASVSDTMSQEEILLGADENGWIALNYNLPDADGIFISLCIAECVAVSGKSVSVLIENIEKLMREE